MAESPGGSIPPPRSASSDSKDSQATLRNRKPRVSTPTPALVDSSLADRNEGETEHEEEAKPEVTYGKTPSGTVFRVPQTHSFVTTLFSTLHRSSLTRWTFLSLIAQPILFFYLANYPAVRSALFLVYFAFWRGAYDLGFAWVLRKQSEKRWVVRLLKQWGWLAGSGSALPGVGVEAIDAKASTATGSGIDTAGSDEGREWAKWWKRELEMKMGEGYKWEEVPVEFNAWLMFRQLVDIVLLNDFVSYSCFAWSNLHFPPNHSVPMHVARWIFGWGLIFFNLWVKMDAHRVVKDYAWYWGDAFWMLVMQHDLVFDGVYEIAPHPMYSVGYAGYYGLSMVVGSYAVLFVSLAAHAAQFAFLLWFENPHIERTYGGAKKPLVSRTPLEWEHSTWRPQADAADIKPLEEVSSPISEDRVDLGAMTPAATEGDTETEPELPELPNNDEGNPSIRKYRSDSSYSFASSSMGEIGAIPKPPMMSRRRAKTVSMHDLTHQYFRKPVIILSRIDFFRQVDVSLKATDFALIVMVIYSLTTLVRPLPPRLALTAHFLHALAWRLFHSYGLGLLLRAQSKSKWLVRHYLKHYHYPGSSTAGGSVAGIDGAEEGEGRGNEETVVKRATEEAFGNWQVGYNISLVMTYVSFAGLAWKTYHLPSDWTVSGTILRHVLGSLLIALHVWAAASTYEALGDFGWLYSDFFLVEHIPSRLAYTGIYRFLNNPEQSMGGAAFFGLWLISNSKMVLSLAIISHLSHWWFLSCVERPHMKRLYGDRLRKDGGLTKTLKSVAGKTLATQAMGRHAPEIQRVVKEVKGSIEKVEEKVTEAVEEFLEHARPMFSDMVNDTKILLQQSRERMIITRVASDLSSYDTSRYSLHVGTTSSSPNARFHAGQPIRVSWTAPSNHSRKDWIGIYRLGSCKSQLVTRIASVGKWMPIYEDEYDGDMEITPRQAQEKRDAGTVTFKGNQLPWTPGMYEMRYHHDGKHNVMSRIAPLEIYVSKPANTSYRAVHDTLLDIVSLSLDLDLALVPQTAKTRSMSVTSADGQERPMTSLLATVSESSPDATKLQHGAEVEGAANEVPTPRLSKLPNPLAVDTAVASDQHQPEAVRSASTGSAPLSPSRNSSGSKAPQADTGDTDDPDNFSIMTEIQAKRIVGLCEHAFGVELSPDVVIAEANVGSLAQRIVGARSLAGRKGLWVDQG